jgi:FG-GAP-like repeat/PKD domain/Ser-Thr-rich glycosyl-phosphatidyl-inositol-anchored membrane family
MKWSRPVSGLCVCLVAGIAALGDATAGAVTSPPPAVSITRNTLLNESVWPGDFNGDGKTDLIGSDAPIGAHRDVLLVQLGDGAGSFGSPIAASFAGRVLGVGDFNRDGKLDVIARDDRGTTVYIVTGNGNGTLGAAQVVADFGQDVTFAVSGDLDGDGKRDLVVGIDGQPTVEVFPGNGDFTFGTPVALTTNLSPSDAIVADFNGDGRKDLAVTNRFFQHSVAVFLNQGSFTFTGADIALDQSATDVTSADVNGDGKLDLIVSTAAPEDSGFFSEGFVNVLLGNGDGTFQTPVIYTVPPGPWQIVVGDFTRDGILDIATANRSTIVRDDCGDPFKTWDTVSILPGRGDGTFDAPSSFSLGDQSLLTDDRFKESVLSLNTSDLNGDRQTDLIASWGAILLNVAPATNRPPTVDAGRGQSFNGGASQVMLQAVASDPDNDMLTYSWSASDGRSIGPVPQTCVSLFEPGTYTFTVTVDDGHGHTASSSVTYTVKAQVFPTVTVTAPKAGEVVPAGTPYTITFTASSDTPMARFDVFVAVVNNNVGTSQTICSNLPGTATSCTWNSPGPITDNAQIDVQAVDADGDESFGLSGRFSIEGAGGGGPLPAGWQNGDVGAVGAAGSAAFANGVFTVEGSGADIWGTADEFQYVRQFVNGNVTGDFDLTARVDSVQNVDVWTKAGLMVRGALDAGSLHASVFVTPGKGVAFQRRTANGGVSVNTSVSSVAAPVWLRLSVSNGRVDAFYKKNVADAWIRIGAQLYSNPYSFGYAGLAVTSHSDGALATAAFSSVDIAPPLPAFTFTPIGTATASGSEDIVMHTVTLGARGADIWGASDQFMFANTPSSGDRVLTTEVRSIDNTNAWAKAGVMFRSSTAAGSAHVSVFITPGKGVAMQYRGSTGGASVQAAQTLGVTAPKFLRLTRRGNTFTGEWSPDLVNWQTLSIVTIPMPTDLLAGLAVTSHNTAATATAVFADPAIR